MIAQLFQILQDIRLDLTAQEVADILWLALSIKQPQETAAQPSLPSETTSSLPQNAPSPDKQRQELPPPSDVQEQNPPQTSGGDDAADAYPSKGESGGNSFHCPTASALSDKLESGRALRPFMRKAASPNRYALDIEATIKQAAEIGKTTNIIPVLTAAPTRWLDVMLIVDESPSMVIWHPAIIEFQRMLEYQGAFRNVKTWGFHINEPHHLVLHEGIRFETNGRTARNPKELIDARKQRLFLLVSDCAHAAWRDGTVAKIIELWGTCHPVAIIQTLPQRLWNRSALGSATPAYFRATRKLSPNVCLFKEENHEDDEQEQPGIPIPVITFEPEALAYWASAIADAGNICCREECCERQHLKHQRLRMRRIQHLQNNYCACFARAHLH